MWKLVENFDAKSTHQVCKYIHDTVTIIVVK